MRSTCSRPPGWATHGRRKAIREREPERVSDDIVRHYKEALGTLAKRKNRPEAVAEAMADKTLQVFQVKNRRTGRIWYLTDAEIHDSNGEWEKGLPVPESGRNQLLTLNGARAHELLLAEPAVRDFDDLKQRLGIPPEINVAEAKRTWVDSLVFWLNTDFGPVLPGRRGLYLHLCRAAFDDGCFVHRCRPVFCAFLLEPLSGRDGGLAGGGSVPDRRRLPGARDLRYSRIRASSASRASC